MARIRTIKPDFFKNDSLAELKPLTRLLFIGLWTLADRRGRLEDRPKRIKAEILPYDEWDCDRALQELMDRGFITRYQAGTIQVIQVNTFEAHQRITGTEASTESRYPAPPKFEPPTPIYIDEEDDPDAPSPAANEETSRKQPGNTGESPRTTGREGKGREKREGTHAREVLIPEKPGDPGGGKIPFLPNVLMTQAEYQTLVDRYGKSTTTKRIEHLSRKKFAKGYVYDSDYHVILEWAEKDGIKPIDYQDPGERAAQNIIQLQKEIQPELAPPDMEFDWFEFLQNKQAVGARGSP